MSLAQISDLHITHLKNSDHFNELLTTLNSNKKFYSLFKTLCLDYVHADFFINLILILFLNKDAHSQNQEQQAMTIDDWVKALYELLEGNKVEHFLTERIKTEFDVVEILKNIKVCLANIIQIGYEINTKVSHNKINLLFDHMYNIYTNVFEEVDDD